MKNKSQLQKGHGRGGDCSHAVVKVAMDVVGIVGVDVAMVVEVSSDVVVVRVDVVRC